MVTAKKRCMICGKAFEDIQSICKACEESIRGEAVGKIRKVGKAADQGLSQQGQAPPKRAEEE